MQAKKENIWMCYWKEKKQCYEKWERSQIIWGDQ